MHIHASQLNLNAEIWAAQAAARVEAKRAAELTRKKLRDFASILAGEFDEEASSVDALGAKGEPQHSSHQQQSHDESDSQDQHASPDDAFSRWA